VTVLVLVLITGIAPEPLATYTRAPSGVMANPE